MEEEKDEEEDNDNDGDDDLSLESFCCFIYSFSSTPSSSSLVVLSSIPMGMMSDVMSAALKSDRSSLPREKQSSMVNSTSSFS
ncbi:uncharacterized protein MONOS_9024 [Monocercomonoides exilis]|uniref:uncharacterized protein n=1 Tax=Monocercomonoides exilis TaxID=2049356 RepID=UPI00355A71C9|nr:hypothetical protein MONOS_9024 [Monocercomonoides exilis]|eukprot:MONOS_9024.1-p1 / transcript=MONOS_9024.1 / gene=MONOS_9024 / organism=Monocercomonoides_exilis_PA203 / gene_product=unspecified product / transcript_product=unspecified product / location=Mono_scaffold00358:34166-34414(-) / protein_length=83 / sequence_SO=supercontig / SO=protein_coding / is_pseudo=false